MDRRGLGQFTAAHDSYITPTEFSQSAALFLEKLSPIPTLKTTCRNRRRSKKVARELTSASRASTKKRIPTGGSREDARENAEHNSKCQQTQCILPLSYL
ncbi:hypothetical protein TNCV_2099181 [Trichonephila clavipes]|nr:hypothetical protein TNCV_2099181 [Trichonephila clavipes]